MASLSSAEQRKLAYFHSLGRAMTENTQLLYESRFKSSHNIRINEIWADDISYCLSYASAVLEATSNAAVTVRQEVQLTEIFGSNGQAYYYTTNGTDFIRPWISPTDVPQQSTNQPSYGFLVKLFRGNDATSGIPGSEIYLTEGSWVVDYYAGIIHFAENYTPDDLGWGSVKTTFFQYTGTFGGVSSNTGGTITPISGVTSKISNSNSNMDVLSTSTGNTLACGIPILDTNILTSTVNVFLNGIKLNVGNLITDDCYFSGDSGVTKRSAGNEVLGDYLYWNYNNGKPVSGYELNPSTDKISFLYLTI